MVTKISEDNFTQEILKSGKRTVLDFYADWCGPCQMLSPVMEELSQKHPEWKFCKTNVDENTPLAIKFGVSSIPAIAVFENGELLDITVGYMSENELSAFIAGV